MKFTLWVWALATLLALVAVYAAAQTESGQIAGTVRDVSGAVVPGATVSVKNTLTGATRPLVRSGEIGQYVVQGLAPGVYELTVNSSTFAVYTAKVEVSVGSHVTLDPVLHADKATTTVEVVAAGGTEVNTQNQEIAQVITPTQMAQLPSLNRNPYDFVGLSGNVSAGDRMGTASDQNTTTHGTGYVINGQRSTGTEILLDGIENADLFLATVGQTVPQDAVQEYRIITNGFDAQYGRASGGIVDLITKGGTNDFHGSLWEYNRTNAMAANTYDNVANGVPEGTFTRNQFGYSVGGPLIKDKLFFFQSTEFLRVRSSASELAYVPTPQLLALSAPSVQSYFQQYGGATGPYLSTLTKADLMNSNPSVINPGGAFDTAVPNNTPLFGLVNYNAPQDAGGGPPQNTHNIVGRLDYNMSSATQIYSRVNWANEVDLPGSLYSGPYSQYNVGSQEYGRSFMASLTHSFSPDVFSSTKLSFSRIQNNYTYNQALQNTPSLDLSSYPSLNGVAVVFPGFYSGIAGGVGLPYGGPQNVIQLNHDVAWNKGRHSMRFGGQINYQQINYGFGSYSQAIEQLGETVPDGLDGLITGNLALFQVAIDPQNKYPCVADTAGNLIASSNCTLSLPVGLPNFSRSDRYLDYALYAQDSWRVTPRLTANYGLRYEYYGVQHDSNPALDSNLYPGAGTTFAQQLQNAVMEPVSQSSVGGLWHPNYGTIGPRVGLAWDPFGKGTTSVRGGYGISYERNYGNITFNVMQNPPNYASVQLTGASAGMVTTNNLGPFAGTSGTVLLSPSSPRPVNPNIDTAQTQMWSLTAEHRFGKSTLLEIDYNGAHGVHLYDVSNYNMLGSGQAYLGEPLSYTCGTGTEGCFTRVNQQWSAINLRGSNGYSHYNAMNVKLQSQDLAHTGIMLVVNYTWAHSLDNLSSTFSESSYSGNGYGNVGYLDPRNPSLDYGNSDFDVRHRIVVSAIWNEPWFKTGPNWKKQLLGGWNMTPVFVARTGLPFTLVDTTNTLAANTLASSGIPRYTPAGTITSYSVNSAVPLGGNNFGLLTLPAANSACQPEWMVIDAVAGGCVESFGPYPANMTARNAFRGPGAWNLDFAIGKRFSLTERVKLEFRAEIFNIFNHHNMYVDGFDNDTAGSVGDFVVVGKKGGLGSMAGYTTGDASDERRFGQLAMRVNF